MLSDNFSSEECTRETMNQNNQKSRLKRAQIGRIASLMLGSVFTGVIIAISPALAAPTTPNNSNSLSKVTASVPLAKAIEATKTTAPAATPATNQVAQASDVAGNWAEPFIKILVEKDIIKGYPDGTFRPDQPITRAEFAALLNKAFDLQPIREGRKFKDVPKNYWAADVIQKAYRSGFLAGYPGSFGPKQNLLRIQGLVSLINGSNLKPSGDLDLNSVFGDAAQVPSYGQNALVAATQKCVAVSVEYDSSRLPGGNFGPNTVATRADVAAYIHQVLVGSGRLPALDPSSPANKYIASCPQGTYVTSITGTPVAPTPVTADEAISKLSIPGQVPAIVGSTGVGTYPVGGLGTPTAFGGNAGFFFGASYQNQTRPNIYSSTATSPKNPEAWAYSAGIGLGDPRNALGLEAVGTTYSRANAGTFDNGGVSFKLNKMSWATTLRSLVVMKMRLPSVTILMVVPMVVGLAMV